jgi:hypothetical protein
VGYFESGVRGFSKNAITPNMAIERIASHQGWKTIGQRMKKMMKTTHRHVSFMPLFPPSAARRTAKGPQGHSHPKGDL